MQPAGTTLEMDKSYCSDNSLSSLISRFILGYSARYTVLFCFDMALKILYGTSAF